MALSKRAQMLRQSKVLVLSKVAPWVRRVTCYACPGCCFLVGGVRFKQQSFNASVNKAASSMLFMAAVALAIPTAAKAFYANTRLTNVDIQNISHGTAIILAFV